MLMRSMPSVYSPIRGSGITTSSLTLKALVCLLIAAVRLRSSQNFLRASGLTATKPSPRAAVGEAHDLAGGARDRVGVVAGDVAEQHHLRQAAALALGGVADRLQVAVVEVLEAGQDRAGRAFAVGEHEVLDVDDRRHRVLGVAEELEAHRARVRRHLVHDPARAE